MALASLFGQPVEYPFVKGLDGFPCITPVIKLEHETHNFGGIWHSDTRYLERPPMARCCSRARCRPTAATPSSPASTSPTKR